MRWREFSNSFRVVVAVLVTLPGLLVASPQKTRAQTIPPPAEGTPLEVCGGGTQNIPFTISIVPNPPRADTGPVDIPVKITVSQGTSSEVVIKSVTANLYWLAAASVDPGSNYNLLPSSSSKQNYSPNSPEMSFLLKTNPQELKNFRYIVRADVEFSRAGRDQISAVKCSSVFPVSSPNEIITWKDYSHADLEKWFDYRFDSLKIQYFNDTPGNPPKVILDANPAIGRPVVTFELEEVSGEGALFVANMVWYTFFTYITLPDGTTEGVSDFYLLVNNSRDTEENSFFYHDSKKNPGDVYSGIIFDSPFLNDVVGNARVSIENTRKLTAFIMNYNSYGGSASIDPLDRGDWKNCNLRNEYHTLKITGPKGKGLTPEPDQNSLLEVGGVSPDDVLLLNQNCMNEENNGWLAYWKVGSQSAFSDSDPGKESCSIAWILDETGFLIPDPPWIAEFGIKNPNIATRAMLCVYGWVIRPVLTWAAGLIEYAAGVARNHTDTSDSRIAYTAWKPDA